MACRACRLIVVLDASVFVSAVLKPDSIPERAFDRALAGPDEVILSDEVEAEYREVIFRPKFDRFVQPGGGNVSSLLSAPLHGASTTIACVRLL